MFITVINAIDQILVLHGYLRLEALADPGFH